MRTILLTENYIVSEQADGGVKATGLALPFGKTSRNGINYDAESVRKSAQTLIGRSILWNHNPEIAPIGHVVDVRVTEDGLHYVADLDPEEKDFIRKIKRGDIKNVSIQAEVNEETIKGNTVEVVDFYELSFCTIPGFPETTAKVENLAKLIKEKEVDDLEKEKEVEAKPEPKEVNEEEPDRIQDLEERIEELIERMANLEAKVNAQEETDDEDEEEEKCDDKKEKDNDKDKEEENDDEKDKEEVKESKQIQTEATETNLIDIIKEVKKR